jgi:hypothetical protein
MREELDPIIKDEFVVLRERRILEDECRYSSDRLEYIRFSVRVNEEPVELLGARIFVTWPKKKGEIEILWPETHMGHILPSDLLGLQKMIKAQQILVDVLTEAKKQLEI